MGLLPVLPEPVPNHRNVAGDVEVVRRRSEEARRVCVLGGIAHFRLDAVRVRLALHFHCHSRKMSKTPLTSFVPRSAYPPGADVRLFTVSKHWWKTSHLG